MKRDALLTAAMSLTWLRESGCNNCGADLNRVILQPQGLRPGSYWCMAFVSVAARKAGLDFGVEEPNQAASWARPSQFVSYERGRGGTVLPADILLYAYPSRGRNDVRRFRGINHGDIAAVWPELGAWYWKICGNCSGNNPQQGVHVVRARKSDVLLAIDTEARLAWAARRKKAGANRSVEIVIN